jgi:hypothetical protein
MFVWKQRLVELERRRQALHGLRRQLEALKPAADQHAECALARPRASVVKHLQRTGEVTVALLPVCTSAVPFQQL